MPTDLTPGSITTLGSLRPGDVGVFVHDEGEGEKFVLTKKGTETGTIWSETGYDRPRLDLPVRYLGRGRIEPPRIVMEGKEDKADGLTLDEQAKIVNECVELESQLVKLREAVVQAAIPLEAINGSVKWELCNALQESVSNAVATIRAALAATAPKEERR